VKMKALLAEDLLGEIGAIRVRAILGGNGAPQVLAPPFGERPLLHPAFDHFFLLTFLGGPAARLTAYLQPMDAQTGGQAMVAVRHQSAGCYSHLECAYAPELSVRSEYYPHDLTVEVAGTNGIIWLRRGMADRTQEPPLTVRVGREAYTIGIESGMTADWAKVYHEAAAEWLAAIGGRVVTRLTTEQALSAFQLRERVVDAAQSGRVVSL